MEGGMGMDGGMEGGRMSAFEKERESMSLCLCAFVRTCVSARACAPTSQACVLACVCLRACVCARAREGAAAR